MTHNPQRGLYNQRASRQIRAIGGEGILVPDDLPRLSGARLAVYELMRDGRWYPRSHIDLVGGDEGMRRMRELREWFTVERRRDERLMRFEYRLGAK